MQQGVLKRCELTGASFKEPTVNCLVKTQEFWVKDGFRMKPKTTICFQLESGQQKEQTTINSQIGDETSPGSGWTMF